MKVIFILIICCISCKDNHGTKQIEYDYVHNQWRELNCGDSCLVLGQSYDDSAIDYIQACGADSILGKYAWRRTEAGQIQFRTGGRWVDIIKREIHLSHQDSSFK